MSVSPRVKNVLASTKFLGYPSKGTESISPSGSSRKSHPRNIRSAMEGRYRISGPGNESGFLPNDSSA